MVNLINFALKQQYSQVKKLRSRLEDMKSLIDWDSFKSLFPQNKSTGRPPYDHILMVRILILQSWYGISDEELEYQIYDRISFQNFLDYPKNIPDFTTIWRFREDLLQGDLLNKIWDELGRQIKNKDIQIKEGYIQDASFVHADPGKTDSGMSRRGKEAKTSRSKDGSWTKKNSKAVFGFKLHTKVQRGSKLIETFDVTTAKTHDNNIDLANEDDIIYRDRGYSGSQTKAKGDGTMKLGKLTIKQKLRNRRISKKRSEGEHPFGTIQRSFKGGRTKLTIIARVYIQQQFFLSISRMFLFYS